MESLLDYVKKSINLPKGFYKPKSKASFSGRKQVTRMVNILIDNDKCTGCGSCVDVCPLGVFEIIDEQSVPANLEDCIVCRACETQCPETAIQVIEEI